GPSALTPRIFGMGSGHARCTLRVRGLDCPGEVPPIRSALEGTPGVLALAFDPVGGTVAIDFDPDRADPPSLAERVTKGSGMAAEVALATVEPPPASTIGRWLPTIGSGVALLVGMAFSWAEAPV